VCRSIAAQKSNAPGVSGTEIKIGQTMPYSGPASTWGTIGRAEIAYVKMINDRGGIKGRKINLISLDDGYSPPKTLEQTRKLVEGEGVSPVRARADRMISLGCRLITSQTGTRSIRFSATSRWKAGVSRMPSGM
jgi:hypothetical protein